jgi:WD40 repeat protein
MRICFSLVLGLVSCFTGIARAQNGAPAEPEPKARLAWEWSELEGPLNGEPASGPLGYSGVPAIGPTSIVFSQDGKWIAAASGDRIIVWSVETKKRVTRMRLPEPQKTIKLAFTPDGKGLVSHGSEDFTYRVWDAATGKQIRELSRPFPSKTIDGKYIAQMTGFAPGGDIGVDISMSPSSGVRLTDTATGTQRIVAPEPSINSVTETRIAFAPDGKTFAMNGPRSQLRIFDTTTGKLERELRRQTAPSGLSLTASYISYSPDGRYLLAGEGTVASNPSTHEYGIWKVEDGKRLLGNRTGLQGLIGPGSRYVVTDSKAVFDIVANELVPIENTPAAERRLVGASADGTMLAFLGPAERARQNPPTNERKIYLTPAPVLAPPIRPGDPMTDEQLGKVWRGFVSANSICRDHSTAVITSKPGLVEEAARKNLKPVTTEEAEQFAKCIKELGDNTPAVWRGAQDRMWGTRLQFAKALAEAEKTAPPGELRTRLMIVRQAYGGPFAISEKAQLEADQRAIAYLEKLATPAALNILKELAGGAPGARRTDDAAAALFRLSGRK